MSDATRGGGTRDDQVRAAGLKVHGDKLDQAIPRDAGGGARDDAAGRHAHDAINPDHPDRTSEPGSGGLMPGSYEQAGGEAGRQPEAGGGTERSGQPAIEGVRAPGSRVPDPKADPRLRDEALHIAGGKTPGEGAR